MAPSLPLAHAARNADEVTHCPTRQTCPKPRETQRLAKLRYWRVKGKRGSWNMSLARDQQQRARPSQRHFALTPNAKLSGRVEREARNVPNRR
jgi:hypothetical protein